MNPNSMPPQGQEPQLTDEALNKKFSFSFTRKQLIVLFNALNPVQLPLGDLRTQVLVEMIDEIRRTALQSITTTDYETPAAAKPLETTPDASVQTN